MLVNLEHTCKAPLAFASAPALARQIWEAIPRQSTTATTKATAALMGTTLISTKCGWGVMGCVKCGVLYG